MQQDVYINPKAGIPPSLLHAIATECFVDEYALGDDGSLCFTFDNPMDAADFSFLIALQSARSFKKK